MTSSTIHIVKGDERYTALANAMSDAINMALRCGLEPDQCCCVAVQVIADYARGEYGNQYLTRLARVVRKRADMPMPELHKDH